MVPGTRWITGANEPGRHVFDLVAGRDFVGDGTVEAADVRAGDPAPDGSGPLELARGIEIGHIFALGRKYAEALGLTVLDENGKAVTVTMGSYGIGVSRAVAALAETNHDDAGLAWPAGVAPAHVYLVAAGKDEAVRAECEELAADLHGQGVEVIYDDRKASPGVKFADAELHRRADHRHGRAEPGRRRRRGAAAASGRRGPGGGGATARGTGAGAGRGRADRRAGREPGGGLTSGRVRDARAAPAPSR